MRFMALLLATTLATPAMAQHWARSWAAAPTESIEFDGGHAPLDLKDHTLRQVVRTSIGGAGVRLRLSNEESDMPVSILAVHIALAGADGSIVPGSDRIVTFSGRASLTLAARTPPISDAVAMPVAPLSRLSISFYFTDSVTRPTWHSFADATGWIAPGDQSGATRLTAAKAYDHRLIISALDVDRPRPASVVVALGDSITDGGVATADADRRWPDQLAARLQQAGMTSVGVANAGIGANRLLQDHYGRSALARLDRDVIAVPGVRHLIVLEGINDIIRGIERPHGPTAQDLIDGYRQIIVRAHAAGIKVQIATITPFGGTSYASPATEAVRQATNHWILTNHEADGAIDFDKAVRDPAAPERIAKPYDFGDHLHFTDAGFTAMAGAIELKTLR